MCSRRAFVVASAIAMYASPLFASELKRWTGSRSAPPVDLLTTDGTPFSLQQQRGKVVLVNFWATWCEPCITEMPSLQRLRDRLGDDGLEVLTINFQEGPERIKEFVQKTRLDLTIVRDTDGSVAKRWGARVFPASYLVDREGNIRYAISGATDWTSPSAMRTIRTLLAPKPPR